jgi:hypothetical protein
MNRVMSHDEREIWRAAYAAAFVLDFEARRRDWEDNGASIVSSPFDEAARSVTAERSITVADLAVARLAQWRQKEDSLAGVELRPHPKAWDE